MGPNRTSTPTSNMLAGVGITSMMTSSPRGMLNMVQLMYLSYPVGFFFSSAASWDLPPPLQREPSVSLRISLAVPIHLRL